MRRGTTPTLKIRITGIPVEELKSIYVTLKQGTTELTKDNGDIEIEGDTLSVPLSQYDTLCMDRGRIEVQVRAVTNTGLATASNITSFFMENILKDGVIT